MDANKFTKKSLEAVQNAQNTAVEYGNSLSSPARTSQRRSLKRTGCAIASCAVQMPMQTAFSAP